ncbi:hypothetical protein EDI_217930 [Entamoeba dispar SAW760]|uniref:Uncharacterized protein n=1 Tax=Entamoeba dispar (strain ATCC PRA-260 / SAW760) TaxID=370354 RepID=B0ENK7_ENTDS|nr:uncharacterized protein EDI_217930 [Entamoeba dispar SAW760]EDR23888.1 hypothetical protein EDI_217930 [Entamoeba dispar SAW760]|eukprot:EDR23888.1 hypothetical protein EDI_217930 [Entamoeba dispar SAW760]
MTENQSKPIDSFGYQIKLIDTQTELEHTRAMVAQQASEIIRLKRKESQVIDLEKELNQLESFMKETEQQMNDINLGNENDRQRLLDDCQKVKLFFESLQSQVDTFQSLESLTSSV